MKKMCAILVFALAIGGSSAWAIQNPCYDAEAKLYDCQCIEYRCFAMCGGNVGSFSCNPTSGVYSCNCR